MLRGPTQNATERFNSTIWRLAPKHLHAGLKIVENAAYIAAGIFNEEYYAVLKIMETLEINFGPQCKEFANTCNDERTKRQERRTLSSTKEARLARKQQHIEQNQLLHEKQL